jgi:TolA-binding protein
MERMYLTQFRFRRLSRTAFAAALAGALGASPLAVWSQEPGQNLGSAPADKPNAPGNQTSSDEALIQFADAVNFQNAGNFGLAADEYTDFLKRHAKDPLVPKAWHYLAVCQLKQQKYDEAIAAAQNALTGGGEKFEVAAETYLSIGLAHYHLGQAAKDDTARKNHLSKSAAALGTVGTKFPTSPHAAQALYFNAEANYAAGRKAEAVKAYEMLVDEYAKSEFVPNALYGLGFALEELNQPEDAGKAYDRFLKDYAKHELVGDVLLHRGETLLAQKKYEEAKPFFAKAAATSDFAQADQALMQQASCAYELKQYDEAAAVYASVAEKFDASPQTPLARMNAGKSLLLLAKLPEARGALAPLLANENADIAAEAAHLTARCLIREKNPAEAATVAAKALATASGGKWGPQLLLDQADATFDQPDKRKSAAEAYLALVKAHPNDPLAAEARFMAAYASLQTNEPKQAQSLAAEFLKGHTDHALAPEAAAVLAESHLLLRDFPAAEKQFRDLIAKFASHRDAPTWQRRLGFALLLAENYPAAIAQLSPLAASAKGAELGDVQYWLATSYFKQKEYAKALAACDASLGAAPDGRNSDRVLLIVAECQAAGKEFAKAKSAVERIATQFPQSSLLPEVAYRTANYTARGGKPQEAIELYQQMLSKYGDDQFAPYAVYGIGLAQSELKDAAAAEKTFTTLLEKYPDHALTADVRYDRAVARQSAGRFEEAAADAQAVLAAKPSPDRAAAARYILGLCQDRLKKPEEAVKTYQALLKDAPNYAEAAGVLFELGWSLKSLKRDDEARQVFAKLAKDHGESPFGAEAHYQLGEYQFNDKAYDKALAEYDAASTKSPPEALAERIAYRTGWTHYRLQQYDKAQAAFQKQLGLSDKGPLAAEGLFMLGECYFQQNKFSEALPAYNQALAKKLNSKDFEVLALLHAGQCAAQAKRWTETIGTLDKLLAAHADSYYVPEALYEQGWAKRNLADEADAKGDAAAAAKLYDEALEKFDTAGRKTDREVGARSRFMMGEIHFLRKNHREAIRNYFKVAEGYPNATAETNRWKAKAAFSLGHVYTAMKLNDDAQKWFRTTIERYPMSEEAKLAKERLAKPAAG